MPEAFQTHWLLPATVVAGLVISASLSWFPMRSDYIFTRSRGASRVVSTDSLALPGCLGIPLPSRV